VSGFAELEQQSARQAHRITLLRRKLLMFKQKEIQRGWVRTLP
jgi:hypothetical protein